MILYPNTFFKNINKLPVLLLYGNDYGLQDALSQALCALKKETGDAVTILSEELLLKDPSVLQPDLFSLQPKGLWVQDISDKSFAVFQDLGVDEYPSFLLLSSGKIKKSSTWVRWAEKQKKIGVLGCYESGRDPLKMDLLGLLLGTHGINLSLSQKRLLTPVDFEEIQKISRHIPLLTSREGKISDEDLKSIIEQAIMASGDAVNYFMQKNRKKLSKIFLDMRTLEEQIFFVRRAQAMLIKFLQVKALEKEKKSFKEAVDSVTSFFQEKNLLNAAQSFWHSESLMKAMSVLFDAEISLKKGEGFFHARLLAL